MEAVEKVHKKKRKREELDKSEESGTFESKSDQDIKHRSKRVHQSSSDGDVDRVIALSVDYHEEMLDTVSGHIQELKIKEKDMDGEDPRTSKAGAKSKKSKKKRTDSSKLGKNGGEGTSLLGDDAQMENTTDISLSGVNQESALEYLRLWKKERERWSFKKKTQYWLLQNMYDRTKVGYSTTLLPHLQIWYSIQHETVFDILLQVPKSGFKIMLRYLSGLQGRQRELSVQKAQKIVDQYGEEGQSSA